MLTCSPQHACRPDGRLEGWKGWSACHRRQVSGNQALLGRKHDHLKVWSADAEEEATASPSSARKAALPVTAPPFEEHVVQALVKQLVQVERA